MDTEIDEFARVYRDPLAAGQILQAAGLDPHRQPVWNARSAAEFWREAARLLGHGAVPEGRRLGVAAQRGFPGNATFAACAGTTVRREWVPVSRETVQAAWPLPSPFVARPALVEAVCAELTPTGAGAEVAKDRAEIIRSYWYGRQGPRWRGYMPGLSTLIKDDLGSYKRIVSQRRRGRVYR